MLARTTHAKNSDQGRDRNAAHGYILEECHDQPLVHTSEQSVAWQRVLLLCCSITVSYPLRANMTTQLLSVSALTSRRSCHASSSRYDQRIRPPILSGRPPRRSILHRRKTPASCRTVHLHHSVVSSTKPRRDSNIPIGPNLNPKIRLGMDLRTSLFTRRPTIAIKEDQSNMPQDLT